MKDHKQVEKYLGRLYGPVEAEITRIRKAVDGLIDPEFTIEWYDDDGDSPILIRGWKPMTDKEKAAAKKKQAAAHKAQATKKAEMEAAERAEYERLMKKYAET